MIRKILVSVAYTKASKGMLVFATDLAKQLSSSIIVLSVINSRDVQAVRTIASMGYDVDGEHYVEGVRKERESFLKEIISDCDFPKDDIDFVIRVGNPVQEILSFALEKKVDLIIMGPKGRSELENILVGSVAERLFRRSPVSILSYRGGEYAKQLKADIQD